MASIEDEEDSKLAAIQVYDVGVDYGDHKFLGELCKIQDYYCEWRKNHVNKPIINNSPSFVNECAFHHFEKVERLFDHERFLYDNYLEYKLEGHGTHWCTIHTSTQPKIN